MILNQRFHNIQLLRKKSCHIGLAPISERVALRNSSLVSLFVFYRILIRFTGNGVIKSFTALPQALTSHLNNNLYLKKIFNYLNVIIDNQEYYLPNATKYEYLIYRNVEKNNIVCLTSKAQKINQASYNKYKHPVNEDTTYKSLVTMLFDNTLPGNALLKMLILERSRISINVTKGELYDFIYNSIQNHGDPLMKKCIDTIHVENAPGKADLIFISEFRVTLRFAENISLISRNHEINNITISLLHNTIPGSKEQQQCILNTGQKNSDIKLEYFYNKNFVKTYLDIKQKTIDPEDFSLNRIKIIDLEKYISLDIQRTQQDYLDSFINHLSQFASNRTVKDLLKDLELYKQDYTKAFLAINKFIICNPNQQYSQMAFIIQEYYYVGKMHKKILEEMPDEDVTNVNAQIFTLEYNEQYQAVASKMKQTPFARKIKEQSFKESLNTINSWTSSSHLKESFINDNI